MFTPENYVRPVLVVVATAIVLALARKKWAPRRLPYPPGPKGYPVIGNVLEFPGDPIWEGLAKMAQKYSE